MLRIKLEVEYNNKTYKNEYYTKKHTNLKLFREIWRLLKDEMEGQLNFPLHHHNKK